MFWEAHTLWFKQKRLKTDILAYFINTLFIK